MSLQEENKAVALRYYNEIMNEGKLAVIDEIMPPDFLFAVTSYPEPIHGRENFKQQLVVMMRTAMPDWHFKVTDLIAQGDTVVGHWIASGTHTGGPIQLVTGTFPADGKRFEISGMSWFRIVKGKILEALINEDDLGMLTQLSALPTSEATPRSAAIRNNESLIASYFNEVMNQGKLEVVDKIAAPDFVLHIPTLPEPIRGIEGLKQFATRVRNGLPDVRFTINRQVVEEEKVAVRWTLTGTHLGEFLGVAATGRPVKDEGADVFHIVNNKIAEIWIVENDFSLMQQLGAIPVSQ